MKADQINSYKEILRGALVNTTKVGKSEVQEVSQEEKETFSSLAASITVDQVAVGQQKKKYCDAENASGKKTNKVGFAQNRKDA